MDRALAALERKDQYRRIAMGACALRLQMLALPRPAIIDFAAEREREDKRRFRLRIRRRKARAAQEPPSRWCRGSRRSATATTTPALITAPGARLGRTTAEPPASPSPREAPMADQRPNPDHRAAEEAALGPIRPPAPLDWDEIAAQADRWLADVVADCRKDNRHG